METVTSFIKNFFVLMLILFVFTYLVPKDRYQKYFQFFIGIFMAVILLAPVVKWITRDDTQAAYRNLEQITDRLNEIEFNEENEEDIFEIFYMDNNTE